MISFVLFSILFIAPSFADDLTCPNSPITSNVPSGHFPLNGLAKFPANYDCSVEVN